MDESFEDLLSKYKQIQLELDCIRKAETMALEPAASPVTDNAAAAPPAEARLAPEPTPELSLGPVGEEQLDKDEKKVFQAFNIKPLRHKLPTPAELDELQRKLEGQDTGVEQMRSFPFRWVSLHSRCVSSGAGPGRSEAAEPEGNVAAAVEEQQQGAPSEQNRSKSKPSDRDRTKAGPRPAGRDRLKQSPKPGPRVPADRSRALGKTHSTKRLINPAVCIQSRDQDHRKCAGKPGLDTSGNLYQYDNYDEAFLSPIMPGIPPPPPPLPPPPDELEPPPKPPFADEEEEEEMLLRETCLMSMANKRVAAAELLSCMFSLQLPRHKSVVVSLKDSDDSDSDLEPCSSSQTVALCEVVTVQPELTAVLLRRPSQCLILCVHRELLQRDEAILRHLLQQELKKSETLRAAETKMVKLREQLQASEKIVAANRTLLKKLQEQESPLQVQRVEQRVSLKKNVAVRLEQDLMQAQLVAGRGPKRPTESNETMVRDGFNFLSDCVSVLSLQPSKLQRLDTAPRGSERHFAELIAQKRRLQQLESEYALKIQKLKEAQARRNKVVPAELPAPAPVPPPPTQSQQLPPSSPFHLPQPSLHDLSQDKLVLDSEDIPETEDQEPEAAPLLAVAKGSRRASLRKSSSSFTKPHLETPNSAASKDSSSSKANKMASSSELPAEMFAGLDVDSLKKRYQQQARLEELLQRELRKIKEDINDSSTGQVITSVQGHMLQLLF
ncbi:hypothetical protein XENOCAPTIV_025703 [Xenoophorus captivus]|uniref:Uncharacterized protein n=1 Tax=Xenoophorus captivus TaxID=1517983 RepID=A0ABV0QP87_9TELE